VDPRPLLTRLHHWAHIRDRLRHARYRAGLEPIRRTTFLGHDFYYPATSLIGRGIAESKDHDAVFRNLARSLPRLAEGLVVDVGANLGTTSLQLLAGNPALQLLAVEPSQRYRTLLRRNCAASESGRVEVADTLLGSERRTAWLYNNSSSASLSEHRYHGHTPLGREKVSMSTLDDLLKGRGPISMIKTDCDGYDMQVLRGGTETLKSWRPLLYMEFAPGLDEEIFEELEWLQGAGYRTMYCLSPPDGVFLLKTETPLVAVEAARREPLDYLDIICPPDQDWWPELDATLQIPALSQGG
jgi:FkbM family methyltransferase